MIKGAPVGRYAQFCGGSLLLDTSVLTAAHCVHMQDDAGNWADIAPADLSVSGGSNIIAPGNDDLVSVVKVIRHSQYLGMAFDFDIALIKLTGPPQVRYVMVQVPDAAFGDQLDQPGVATVLMGWGLLELAAKGFGYAAGVLSVKHEDAYAVWDQLMAKASAPMRQNMRCSRPIRGVQFPALVGNGDRGQSVKRL